MESEAQHYLTGAKLKCVIWYYSSTIDILFPVWNTQDPSRAVLQTQYSQKEMQNHNAVLSEQSVPSQAGSAEKMGVWRKIVKNHAFHICVKLSLLMWTLPIVRTWFTYYVWRGENICEQSSFTHVNLCGQPCPLCGQVRRIVWRTSVDSSGQCGQCRGHLWTAASHWLCH